MLFHRSLVSQNRKQNNLQIFVKYVHVNYGAFAAVMIAFWGFPGFLIYLAKYFWLALISPYFMFQQFFCDSNVMYTKQLVQFC